MSKGAAKMDVLAKDMKAAKKTLRVVHWMTGKTRGGNFRHWLLIQWPRRLNRK